MQSLGTFSFDVVLTIVFRLFPLDLKLVLCYQKEEEAEAMAATN